jgi:hypothetical protein
MGRPDGDPGPSVGYLHFIDGRRGGSRPHPPDIPVLYLSINCFSSLFPFRVSCLSSPQLSYDCSLSRLVDLVGFRPCAHLLWLKCYPPDPPTRFNFTRTYHVTCSPLRDSFLSLVGCSLYFYLLFGLLSIPSIPCRCCDKIS